MKAHRLRILSPSLNF